MDLRPNKAEELFLTLSYNRFYDLFDEVINDEFWLNDPWIRFSKISQAFSIYSELLSYEPIKYIIELMKNKRPPMESEIGGELFKFIRNVLSHFPFYKSWDEVWINKELVNWEKRGLSIDKFLKKYCGSEQVKYRIWEGSKKKMTYLSIKFPQSYHQNKIYLKDILTEKDGIKFSFIMMKQIIDTQVESVRNEE